MNRRPFPRIDKPCVMCGEIMSNVISKQKYCPECREKVKKAFMRKQSEQRREERHKVIQRSNSLIDIARAASEAGMTYGKYVLMMSQEKVTE